MSLRSCASLQAKCGERALMPARFAALRAMLHRMTRYYAYSAPKSMPPRAVRADETFAIFIIAAAIKAFFLIYIGALTAIGYIM